MNGYDLHEMLVRWWFLNGNTPFLVGALKVAGVCFLTAFVLMARREI